MPTHHAVAPVAALGRLGPARGCVDELRMADSQVTFKRQNDVEKDGASQGDVVHRVQDVDEQRVVGRGGVVEGLDEGELGHGGHEEEGVERRHDGQDPVEG